MSDWQTVCALEALTEGAAYEAFIQGRPVALARHEGQVYALEDRCPHREGQLSCGQVADGKLICPLHGWDFDLATGISPYNPHDAIATYPVRVLDDGQVQLDADAVPPLPAGTFDGYQGRWRRWGHGGDRGHYAVRRLAKGKPPLVEAMGAEPEPLSHDLDGSHLGLAAAQLDRMPRLAEEAVDTATVIGHGADHPLEIALPAFVSHMSFGALSREAKIALARGAAEAGVAIGSGEGGMLPAERDAAGTYILEMASGYFGWGEAAMARADAFEIKLGQSAKPGLGGELPARKITEEIAQVRGIAPGSSARAPARFPGIDSAEALGERIAEIRARFPGRPIGIKIAANRVDADVDAALALAPDYITLDGAGGGTGAAPVHIRDQMGLPLFRALPRARRRIDRHNAEPASRPVDLVATGRLRTPADVTKAVALGADACALATAALFALGCEYYRACDSGHCPVGITTQDPELRARLDGDQAAEQVARFFTGMQGMMADYLRAMGHTTPRTLGRHDLVPWSRDAADLLDDPLAAATAPAPRS